MNWKTMSPLTILIIVILALVGTVGVIYAVGYFVEIGGNVTVISTDSYVTANTSILDWVTLTRDESKNMTVHLHNTGETDTGALLITYSDFPSSNLNIDYVRTIPSPLTSIPAGESRDITFTLTALSDAERIAYNFGITIDYTPA